MLARNPETLTSLIAWLETMPNEQEYTYADYRHCMAAQYCAFAGLQYGQNREGCVDFRHQMELIGRDEPRNFGAALKRARAAA